MEASFLFFCLHKLFGALLFVGAILFVLWANKLKQDELLKIVKWVVGVGLIGMLLFGLLGGSMGGMRGRYGDHGMWKDGKMMKMMDADMKTGDAVEKAVTN